jgi:dTDP-4-dehydrorhamnose 3,5-epimerase
MRRIETSLPGLLVLEPQVFTDPRGFFFESYHEQRFTELGIPARFVQDNHSHSVRDTLRGLHYQVRRPQAKLCRVAQGEVLDVAVDIRRGSPHFGRWEAVRLSAHNRRQVYIPHGFAHGFLVLSETADFLYKCEELYYPDDQGSIAWNDPDLGIGWGMEAPLLSEKDRLAPRLSELAPEALPVYAGG